MTVGDVVAFLESFAPLNLAEAWDNVGLLVGDKNRPASRIMTCLTVTPTTVSEAVEAKADLIVSHHPVLFRPTQKLTSETPEGRLLLPLLRASVAVYSPHTAFDNCTGGINDLLSVRLGLVRVKPLRSRPASRVKIVVFVPDSDLAKVSDALFEAGAGTIGEYRECSFRLPGTGTFFGSETTHPTVGQRGRREEVAEWRLEVICDADKAAEAIRRMRQAHSYEEPAFDVYPLQPISDRHGIGRLGELEPPLSLCDFASQVRSVLSCSGVRVVGNPNRLIRRAAVACGAGGELLADAVRAEADVFVTGELRFHDELAAEASGLSLVVAGHYATERPGVEHLAEILARQFPQLTAWASRREHDVAWNL
ncbi:MAG: Nif3-like dinuclear metal center hexameric protein [Gemmatales bacterium]|nr:Nif3-like dinuclear metal center hexameric protein [Gemmatales bacterium]MDW8385669.1 Nif3-like dinuclear metal center hexameric protein [Gemmatales bacterium]